MPLFFVGFSVDVSSSLLHLHGRTCGRETVFAFLGSLFLSFFFLFVLFLFFLFLLFLFLFLLARHTWHDGSSHLQTHAETHTVYVFFNVYAKDLFSHAHCMDICRSFSVFFSSRCSHSLSLFTLSVSPFISLFRSCAQGLSSPKGDERRWQRRYLTRPPGAVTTPTTEPQTDPHLFSFSSPSSFRDFSSSSISLYTSFDSTTSLFTHGR